MTQALGTLNKTSLAGDTDRRGHTLTPTLSGSSDSGCLAFRAQGGGQLHPSGQSHSPRGPGGGTRQPPAPLSALAAPAPLTLLLVEPPDEAAVAVGLQQQLLEELPQVDGLPRAGRVHFAVRPALLAGRGWAAREGGGEWGLAATPASLAATPATSDHGARPSLPGPAHHRSGQPRRRSSLSSRPLQDKERRLGPRRGLGAGGAFGGTVAQRPRCPGGPLPPASGAASGKGTGVSELGGA